MNFAYLLNAWQWFHPLAPHTLPWIPFTHDNTEIQFGNIILCKGAVFLIKGLMSCPLMSHDQLRGPDWLRHQNRVVTEGHGEEAILRAVYFLLGFRFSGARTESIPSTVPRHRDRGNNPYVTAWICFLLKNPTGPGINKFTFIYKWKKRYFSATCIH